jgi:predicted RNase H-like HicB family nuclease
MDLAEHLAVPYLLTTYAATLHDGTWQRFAAYPELGCVTHADTIIEALDKLEEARVGLILERLASGRDIPTPRPPLRSLMAELDPEQLRELRARLATLSNGTSPGHGDMNGAGEGKP